MASIAEVGAISIEDIDSEVTIINKGKDRKEVGNTPNDGEYKYVELDPKRYYSSALDFNVQGASRNTLQSTGIGDKFHTSKENNRLS